jgi:hypothetical protein
MIGNGHVQCCSGRGRGNPPPDRNRLRLEGELEIRAVFPDGDVRITQFQTLAEPKAERDSKSS